MVKKFLDRILEEFSEALKIKEPENEKKEAELAFISPRNFQIHPQLYPLLGPNGEPSITANFLQNTSVRDLVEQGNITSSRVDTLSRQLEEISDVWKAHLLLRSYINNRLMFSLDYVLILLKLVLPSLIIPAIIYLDVSIYYKLLQQIISESPELKMVAFASIGGLIVGTEILNRKFKIYFKYLLTLLTAFFVIYGAYGTVKYRMLEGKISGYIETENVASFLESNAENQPVIPQNSDEQSVEKLIQTARITGETLITLTSFFVTILTAMLLSFYLNEVEALIQAIRINGLKNHRSLLSKIQREERKLQRESERLQNELEHEYQKISRELNSIIRALKKHAYVKNMRKKKESKDEEYSAAA